jgi:hypothetical protein
MRKMNKTKKMPAAVFILSLFLIHPVIAEEAAAKRAEPPVKGELQSSVEKIFGSPKEKKPAVGEPPISRWVYEDFTVYFENDHVVHTVLHAK